MTDTPLNATDALFVAEYIKDRNPIAACRRAGIPPRMSGKLLANADVKAAIAEREAAAAAGEAIDEGDTTELVRQRLIRETDSAIALAREAGNLSALAVHIAQRAKLSGLAGVMSGDEITDNTVAPEVDPRDTARAILEVLVTATGKTGVGWKFSRPGYELIEVPQGMAEAGLVGGTPGYATFDEALNAPRDPAPPTDIASIISKAVAGALRNQAKPPEPPVAPVNSSTPEPRVVFESDTAPYGIDHRGKPKRADKPKTGFAVYDAKGIRQGFFLDEEAANACASMLKQQRK